MKVKEETIILRFVTKPHQNVSPSVCSILESHKHSAIVCFSSGTYYEQ